MSYKSTRFIVRAIIRMIAHVEVTDLENMPTTGALIAVSNHLGRLDALMPYRFSDRTDITMLIAEKYYANPVFRFLGKQLDGVFIDRFNADVGTLREVFSRLKRGVLLVMAPEGTRSPTEGLIEGKPGTGYLAAKAGVPIVPVGITGTEDRLVMQQLRCLRRIQIKARVGKPFILPPFDNKNREAAIQHATDEIMCQIAALIPPHNRGIYADHPRLAELLSQTSPNGKVKRL
jgi:1-acyl-sn-glycerol-3-phosphate acyltransferase